MRKMIHAFLFAALALGLCSCREKRTPLEYQIPQGHEGPLLILYSQKGAPALSVKEGFRIAKFGPGGILKTSSNQSFGSGLDRYFYINPQGKKTVIDQGYFVHGGHHFGDEKCSWYEFLLKDKRQFNKDGKLDRDRFNKWIGEMYKKNQKLIRDTMDACPK